MGVAALDESTVSHFIAGVVCVVVFDVWVPQHTALLVLVANAVHLLMELNERNRCENNPTVVLESLANHIGDIVGFAVGCLLGVWLLPMVRQATDWQPLLLSTCLYGGQAIVLYCAVSEIGRELFPYADNWWFKGAFIAGCPRD